MAYELKINIKRGTVIGGGLANNTYVEVWIDGMLVETTPSVPSPPEWNRKVSQEFDTLEPATPIIISFSMYKKRWTSEGYKLVGSAQFSLADLSEKLNKGPQLKTVNLIASRKNITLSGSLQIVLDLIELSPIDKPAAIVDSSPGKSAKIGKGGFLFRLTQALSPPKDAVPVDPATLGIVSQAYRYLFHFDNQVFGRLVKLLVLMVWIMLLWYGGRSWLDTSDKLTNANARIDAIYSAFQQVVAPFVDASSDSPML
jgi:hypothetical protein